MKKQVISVLCAAFLLLFAVTPSVAGAAKTEFGEMLEDYDRLWEDLAANYPFFPVLESRGIDADSLRQSNREVLVSRIKGLDGFLFLLRDTFYRMENFAHLSLVDTDLFAASLSWNAQNPSEPWDEILSNPQTQAIYGFMSASADAAPFRYPDVTMRYLPDIKGAYFHFKSFDGSLIARDEGIVADYLASLEDVQHVIIDITGNAGGSTQYWRDLIVAPFGGRYEAETYILLKDTPVNQRYYMNNGLLDILPLSAFPPEVALSPMAREMGFTHFCHGVFSPDGSAEIMSAPLAKRWVLIDQGTFSAADGFAAFCKNSGWATLVGKTTLGDGADGLPPVMIPLTNTGLLVRFSSTSGINQDGTLNAITGTAPDMECKAGESPLDACLRVISGRL